MDDLELLKAYAEGKSDAAFAELVRRHLDLVYAAALRQVGGDPHRAREVAQSVFTDLARKAGTVARHPALAGWLYTSTFYAAAKLMRAERRRAFHEREAAAAMAGDEPAPDWQRLQPVLDAAMHELGGAERDAIVLRYFEQRPMTEVGKVLGLTESGARKKVERALERLRVCLGRRGIVSAPAALSLALASQAVSAAPAGLARAVSEGALAAGSGVASTGTLALVFMSTTKLQLGFAAAVIVGLGGLWLAQQGQLERRRTENAEIQRQLARLGAETEATRRRAAELRVAIDAQADTAAAWLKPAETLGPAPVDYVTERGQLDQNYAGLFRRLQLDPGTLEQLRDRMAERITRAWAVRKYVVVATGQWMDAWASKTEEMEYVATGTRDIDDRIRALLGEEKFALYLAYEMTMPWRTPFKELAAVLEPIESLTEIQIDQLTAWTAQADPDFYVDPVKSGTRIPDEVVTRAQDLLSPVQLAKLRQAKASSDAYRTMQLASKARIREEETRSAAPQP